MHRHLRLVVIHPAELSAEVDEVGKAVDWVNRVICAERGLCIDLFRWERDGYTSIHPDGFQRGVVDPALRIDEANIVVALFARRLGSSDPRLGGKTGTQHELDRALARLGSDSQKPHIAVYVRREEAVAPWRDPTAERQRTELMAYLRRIELEFGGCIAEFQDVRGLYDTLLQDLSNYVLATRPLAMVTGAAARSPLAKLELDAVLACPPDAQQWAEQLRQCLASRGYTAALLDLDDPGARPKWQARNGILVVTPDALHSPWASSAHSRLLANGRGHPSFKLIPVCLGAAETTTMPQPGGVSFSSAAGFEASLGELAALLDDNAPSEIRQGRASSLSPLATLPTWPKAPNSERSFLEQVLDGLASDAVLLLAQEDRVNVAAVEEILRLAGERYAQGPILYLVPLFSSAATAEDYFSALGEAARFPEASPSSAAFERGLRRRLDQIGRSLLVINGIENGSEAHGYELAGILRAVHQDAHQRVHLLVLGGPRLTNMHYAGNRLSPLAFALPTEWPELTLVDVNAWFAASTQGPPLRAEFVPELLVLTGGHPRLLKLCLQRFQRTGDRDLTGYRAILHNSVYLQRLFSSLASSHKAKAIRGYLSAPDLGPAELSITDDVVAELYWKNLLKRSEHRNARRLVWRSDLIREVGTAMFDRGSER